MRSSSEATGELPGRPLLCIGHSQVRCVMEAACDRGVPLTAINFWHYEPPHVVTRDGRSRFAEAIERQLTGGPAFSMIGGTAHARIGLAVHPRRFDFVLPSAPRLPLDPRAEIVPFDAVRAAMLEVAAPALEMMALLKAAIEGPVFHFEPAPVFADEARIRPDLPVAFFGSRREVSPRFMRYKLWRLHSQILRERCRELNITFVPHPPESVDADGFLRAEHYLDAMHVSRTYGVLVLDQIRAIA